MIGLIALLLAIPADARLALHAGEHRIEKISPGFDAPDRFRVIEFDAQGRAERGPDGKLVALQVQSHGDSHPQRVVRMR